MNTKDKFLTVLEFFLWILFVYTIIYSIRNSTNILLSAIIIVVLGYSAAIACPLIRQTKAFKKVYKRK